MARRFNPVLHPRGPNGRFTESFAAVMTRLERTRARHVVEAFKPKRGVATPQGARGYLAGIGRTSKPVGAFLNGGFVDVNASLRAGNADTPHVKALDGEMFDLPDDVVVSRRVPAAMFGDVDPASLAGMRVSDAGYTAASLVTIKANATDVRMRIAVPKGTRVAVHPETGTLILDRGAELAVARVETNSAGGHDMYLTVLPGTGSGGKDHIGGRAKGSAGDGDTAGSAKVDKSAGAGGTSAGSTSSAQTTTSTGNSGGLRSRAELEKMRVVDLQQLVRDRGLRPGKLRKAQLVDLLADDTEDGTVQAKSKTTTGGQQTSGSGAANNSGAASSSTATAQQPKSPNPSVVTGVAAVWYDVLPADTGDTPVPVRGFEINGYVMPKGHMWRVDGITYLVEEPPAGHSLTPAKILADFQKVRSQLPPDADLYQRGYAWLVGRNPLDSYWEQKYNRQGFRSFATAGDGSVRMWGQDNQSAGPSGHMDSLRHEFGHNVSASVRDRGLDHTGQAWADAVAGDGVAKRPAWSTVNVTRAHSIAYATDRGAGFPNGVTGYGKSAATEDYAESMSLYLSGVLGNGQLTPGGPVVPIFFRDLFPGRAAVLDQIYPAIAAQQKAQIAQLSR